MGHPTSPFVFLAFFFCCLISASLAYNTFHVGGKDGWVLHRSEPYNHWAERLRFQISDTLIFKYNNESDSVLQVKKDAYNSCKTKNRTKSMTSGRSVFQFDHSGLFYFITGNKHNCIWVLSPRPSTVVPKPPSTTPASAPAPKLLTPPVAPESSPLNHAPPPGHEGGPTAAVTAPAPAPSDSMIVSPSSLMVSGVTLSASVVMLAVSQ